MSRIDELNESISQREDSLKYAREVIALREPQLAELRKELAALKAESEKPREFEVAMDKYGSIHGVIKPKSELLTIGDGTSPTFTVIEKKPIVVTVDMAAKFYRAFNAEMGFVHQHIRMVTGLNAIGIEARARND